jgi:acetamidase/formamidase
MGREHRLQAPGRRSDAVPPISVDGALLSVGDGHARQADGEISSTAIECPIEHGQIRIEIDNRQIATPIARTATTWLTFGFHPDLDEAAVIAIESMLELLGREYGIEQRDAIALASVVVDVRLTQLVNGSRGVHTLIPREVFE